MSVKAWIASIGLLSLYGALWAAPVTERFSRMPWEGVRSFCPLDNGGLAFVRGPALFPNGDPEIPVKVEVVDKSGQPVWSREYRASGLQALGLGITQTMDGGLAVVGYYRSGALRGDQGFFMKLSGSGERLFHKEFDGPGDDRLRVVVPTPDSGFILAGEGGLTASQTHAVLLKVDKEGGSQWFYEATQFAYSTASGVRLTSDGSLVVAGTFRTAGSQTGKDAFLAKFDADTGGPEWFRTMAGPGDDVANDVDTTEDGGYILAGSSVRPGFSASEMALVKTDAQGYPVWYRYTGEQSANEAGFAVKAMDGGYLVTGRINAEQVHRFEADGSRAWSFNIGDASGTTGSMVNPGAGFPIIPEGAGRFLVCAGACVHIVDDDFSAPRLPDSLRPRIATAGGSERFYLPVIGKQLSFQWRRNGVEIPGATSDTLAIPVVRFDDSGSYSLRVSNPRGSGESGAGYMTVREPLVNLALGKPAYAPQFSSAFAGAKAVDGSRYDATGNYWLLPNTSPGALFIDLQGDFEIAIIDLYNTSNSYGNDRACKRFRLQVLDGAEVEVFGIVDSLPFPSLNNAGNPIAPYTVSLPARTFAHYLKISVESWYPTRSGLFWNLPIYPSEDASNEGGGLNEVMVFGTPSLR